MTAKKIRIEGYLFLEGNILKNPSIELGKNYLTIKESEDGHFTHKGFAIPGLINAHTHLDFHKPINERDFIKWIVKIIKEEVNPKRGYENVDKKIEGLINIGVTRIYDITRNMVTESNDPITPFFEIIGKDSTEIPEIPKNMMISLHAPYSVSQNLAKRIVERYRKKSFVMHFLETEEEQKFLTGKNNRFEEVIYPIISRKRETESFSTPSEFLIKIGYRGIRKALVHFVEVTEKDIEIVSRLKNSVIVCPRSNLFFSGKVAPIKNLMNRGINVA
ncbi:MAG: amidohydrolase family protein, partial [Thermosulfidibacteraceae bacterium]